MARPRSKAGGKGPRVTFTCQDRLVADILSSIQRERRSSFIERAVLYYASTPEGSEVISFITNSEPTFRAAAASATGRKAPAGAPQKERRATENKTVLKRRNPFGARTSGSSTETAQAKSDKPPSGTGAPGRREPRKPEGKAEKPEGKTEREGLSDILGDFEGNE